MTPNVLMSVTLSKILSRKSKTFPRNFILWNVLSSQVARESGHLLSLNNRISQKESFYHLLRHVPNSLRDDSSLN